MAHASNIQLVRKARGAFFTPPNMAQYMTRWAVRSPSDSVLEPSCGEAVFLAETADRLRSLGLSGDLGTQLTGVDIHRQSLEAARDRLASRKVRACLVESDFFEFQSDRSFDVVLGNPPYIRYQKFAGSAREKSLAAALAMGVRLPRLASSWAAFVVHSASFLRPEGRTALVVPAELLSVNYAGPVRRFLLERFARVKLVVFEELVFPGVLAEVVLLLAEGSGGTSCFELHQARNLNDLESLEPSTWIPPNAGGKWSPALMAAEPTRVYSDILSKDSFTDLASWGKTNLGMVSGNNKFFALTKDQVQVLGLPQRDLVKISPPGSRHLRGLTITARHWRELLQASRPVYLFDPDSVQPSLEGLRYIRCGEKRGVDRAYKCRVRTPWWKVPKVAVPDLFLTYMNHVAPQLVANRARLQYLNSIHGVVLKPGLRQLGMDLLPIAMLNSVTLLGAELVGRSYGGGMLKLEPKEADNLPLPSPESIKGAEGSLRALRPQLSKYLRNRQLLDVVRMVDRVLLRGQLKISRADVRKLSGAREKFFNRRATRTRRI